MKILFFGPWVGEWGWEVFECQGKIRSMSKNYDKVICSSLERNKLLYQDFCQEFIPFDHDRLHSNMCNSNLRDSDNILNSKEYQLLIQKYLKVYPEMEIIKPGDYIAWENQEFKRYGSFKEELKYDIVLHMRKRDTRDSRNWPEENWKKLLKMLRGFKIACIGTNIDYFFDGIDDFRGCSLEEESDLLYSSNMVVGCISGGIHFASLCNCKQISWGKPNPLYEDRILRSWNPFLLKNSYIPIPYPAPKKIYDEIIKNE